MEQTQFGGIRETKKKEGTILHFSVFSEAGLIIILFIMSTFLEMIWTWYDPGQDLHFFNFGNLYSNYIHIFDYG
ncbi:hypothetical protein LX92_04368 [Maribacter polysiphoniae]|uniref:Uncharacterized protein n=1 Tax=Maribacter polysiphoniae TaxID=429344 RepID=A0A316DJC9_9FLAO|nr:hypothetical protein LX92_04368 [Maribacter polysiphoniae]